MYVLLLACIAATAVAADPVDVVFINGNVYTGNEKQPHAEAVAVKGDRVVFVGSNEEAKKFGGNVMDLQGRTVLPV